jgi:hypothetical protein
MPSTQQLCKAGGLLRAVMLLRRAWEMSVVEAWIKDKFPGYTDAQYKQVVQLAADGIAFCDAIDWTDNTTPLDLSGAPRIP